MDKEYLMNSTDLQCWTFRQLTMRMSSGAHESRWQISREQHLNYSVMNWIRNLRV